MKKLYFFFSFLINSNIFVSCCILSLCLSSEFILLNSKISFPSKVSQFVFFASIFTYNFQRIVRLKLLEIHPKKDWIKINKSFIYIIMIIAVIISLYFFINFKNTATQIIIVLCGLLSVLYPFILRSIPFLKIFIISFVWTLSTMFLVVVENEIPLNNNIILHLVSRFLFVFAICIPFDIRDLKHDNIRIKTLPIVFGVSKSRLIAFSSLLIAMIISVFQSLTNYLNTEFLVSFMVLFVIAAILINKSDEKKPNFFFSFWIESLSIFLYLFLVISISIF
mgnify:CR=1 FL=1